MGFSAHRRTIRRAACDCRPPFTQRGILIHDRFKDVAAQPQPAITTLRLPPLIPVARDLDLSDAVRASDMLLISRVAVPPTPHAYLSALQAKGRTHLMLIS